jgi:uncharacterized glyoxalase superfamily protein PhnB
MGQLQQRSTLIPSIRYRDALAAIDWLCRALGFTQHVVYQGPNDTVEHAQLTLSGGMIMIGTAQPDGALASILIAPSDISGRETQIPYVCVPDCDATYATAKGAGAEMLIDLRTMDYGGKAFTCRDPEGHVWSVGDYDPWAQQH